MNYKTLDQDANWKRWNDEVIANEPAHLGMFYKFVPKGIKTNGDVYLTLKEEWKGEILNKAKAILGSAGHIPGKAPNWFTCPKCQTVDQCGHCTHKHQSKPCRYCDCKTFISQVNKPTKYRINYRRIGHDWRTDDEPVLYDSMTEAEIAAMGPAYNGLETKVIAVEFKS